MKLNLLLFLFVFSAMGCREEKEVQVMMTEISQKKLEALKLVEAKPISQQQLLSIQEYFFQLGERVFLLETEPEVAKFAQKYFRRMGTQKFCETFVLDLNSWQQIRAVCNANGSDLCSSEINTYLEKRRQLFTLLGLDHDPCQ